MPAARQCCQQQHLARRVCLGDLRGRLDAGRTGHVDIEQGHIRPMLGDSGKHQVAPTHASHDLEPGLRAQQRLERLGHEVDILSNEQSQSGIAHPVPSANCPIPARIDDLAAASASSGSRTA